MKENFKLSNSELLRQKAEKLLKEKNLKTPPPSAEADMQKLVHELQVYQIELEMQNEELKAARKYAEELSDQKYAKLYDLSPCGYITLSVDGKIVELNISAAEILGKEKQSIINSSFEVFLSNASKSNFHVFIDNVFKNKVKEKCYVEILTKGSIPLYVHLSAIAQENGKQCLIALFDNTDRQQAEMGLKESELNHKDFVNQLPDIIYKYSNKRGSLFWSESVKNILGFETAELQKNPFLWMNSIHPDDIDYVREAIESQKDEHNSTIEYRIKTKSGTWIWLHDYFIYKTLQGDEIIIEGHASDITHQKIMEFSLKEKEEKYRTLLENIGEGIGFVNPSEEFEFVNPAAERIFGVGKNQLLGKNLRLFISPEQYLAVLDQTRMRIAGRRTNYDIELILPNDKIRNINVTAVPQFDTFNNYIGALGIFTDTTERMQVVRALKESEHKFRTLFESAQEGIIQFTVDGKILAVNESFASMHGYTIDEMLKMNIKDLNTSETNKGMDARIEKFSKGESLTFEVEHFCKNGQTIPFEVSANKMSVGENNYILSFHRDITDRKLAEKALRESEEKFRSLVANIQGAVYRCSASFPWGLEYFSEPIAEITGFEVEEFLTKKIDFTDLIHADDINLVKSVIGNGVKNHKEYELEYRITNKKGECVWVFERGKAVYNSNGVAQYLIGVILNITDRKETEIRLQKYALELNNHIADKDRFISILAHDLKNPFSVLLGFSGLLAKNIRKYDIDKIENQVNIINQTTKQTFHLLDELLLWARAQTGKLPYKPQKINLALVCNQIIEILRLAAMAKNITLDYLGKDEIVIFADINMVNTILRNLISNAIKFTKSDGKIFIFAEKHSTEATITVSDNGIGIAPHIINKMFDISQNHSSKGTANEAGTGLGLLLCKEFVEKHGCKIWVESELGKGSNFNFTMPLCVERKN